MRVSLSGSAARQVSAWLLAAGMSIFGATFAHAKTDTLPPPAPYWSPADCAQLADVAFQIAQLRDMGIKREAYRAHLIRINRDEVADLVLARLLAEFDRAFDAKRGGRLTPQQVAHDTLRRCSPPADRPPQRPRPAATLKEE